MILALMAYALLTSMLIGLAALAAERILEAQALPRRGIWCASLIVLLALPATAVFPSEAPVYGQASLTASDVHEPERSVTGTPVPEVSRNTEFLELLDASEPPTTHRAVIVHEDRLSMDTADDAAIIKRYFPDAGKGHLPVGERRWLLLGRDGRILGAGQGVYPNSEVHRRELEARFPGVKVGVPWQPGSADCLGGSESERERLRVTCVWISPNSPLP